MRPAVVLLSGGLDSATVAAIARSRRLRRARAELQLRPAALGRARRGAARGATRRASHEHKTIPIDLRAFGGSALTDDIEVPKAGPPTTWADGIPVTYVPARNTIFLSFALAWAEVLGSSDVFIGVNALDYSGYPDCRPEFIAAYQDMARIATKAGVEGATELTIHAPLIDMTKAEIIELGTSLGVDFGITVSCYDASADGRRVRSVRFVPAATQGLRRGRRRRPDEVPRRTGRGMTYLVKEMFFTLAGRGLQRRHPRRVLPLRRLQPLDRPRGAPIDRRLPVLRHRLRRDRRRRRREVPDPRRIWPLPSPPTWAADSNAERFVVCTGGEPLLQLDESAIDALHAEGFRVAVETNGTVDVPDGLDWVCVSPKAGSHLVVTTGDELKLVYPQPGLEPADFVDLRFEHRFLQPMDGPDREANTARRRSLLPGAPALAI